MLVAAEVEQMAQVAQLLLDRVELVVAVLVDLQLFLLLLMAAQEQQILVEVAAARHKKVLVEQAAPASSF
jgi:hypothetical protein